jgi:hypothetical protein
MKRAIQILARGAAPVALAMGVVGALSVPAVASPGSVDAAPAPASTAAMTAVAVTNAAMSSPLPSWGYDDRRHHTNRDQCRRFGGHDRWDNRRRHFYCHGGRNDQDWF